MFHLVKHHIRKVSVTLDTRILLYWRFQKVHNKISIHFSETTSKDSAACNLYISFMKYSTKCSISQKFQNCRVAASHLMGNRKHAHTPLKLAYSELFSETSVFPML